MRVVGGVACGGGDGGRRAALRECRVGRCHDPHLLATAPRTDPRSHRPLWLCSVVDSLDGRVKYVVPIHSTSDTGDVNEQSAAHWCATLQYACGQVAHEFRLFGGDATVHAWKE